MRNAAIAIALLAFVATLAGCRGGDDVVEPADPTAATTLEITLWPGGRDGEQLRLGTLSCDPPAGNARDPKEACAFLADGVPVLWQDRGDQACTMIYGGPEEARIVGTVGGEPVEVELSRRDGCEIDIWDQSIAVLPDYEPVPPDQW